MYDNVLTFLRHVTWQNKKSEGHTLLHMDTHICLIVNGQVTNIDTEVNTNNRLLFVCIVQVWHISKLQT
jgi:hypothetical protein